MRIGVLRSVEAFRRLDEMKSTFPAGAILLLALLFNLPPQVAAARPQHADSRWTETAANAWYAKQPWLVGSNFIPATAINELEMW
jgi:hypothetical protein